MVKFKFSKTHLHPQINTTQSSLVMQRWNFMQYEIIPDLIDEIGVLTPKLVKVIHTLEWAWKCLTPLRGRIS